MFYLQIMNGSNFLGAHLCKVLHHPFRALFIPFLTTYKCSCTNVHAICGFQNTHIATCGKI